MPGPPWLRQWLHDAGFRMTLPRQAIVRVLAASNGHLSAEDIFVRVHGRYRGIGMATVYRTLDLLTQMGLVFKFDFGDGKNRYELGDRTARGPHHHMVCASCGRVIDFGGLEDGEGRAIRELADSLSRKHGFEIHAEQVCFYGRCDRCVQAQQENNYVHRTGGPRR